MFCNEIVYTRGKDFNKVPGSTDETEIGNTDVRSVVFTPFSFLFIHFLRADYGEFFPRVFDGVL